MAYLTVRTAQARRVHTLGPETVVGRGVSSHVMLDDPRSSKRHFEIRERAGRYLLKDLGSTNGTFMRGLRLQQEVSLQDGDEIMVGSTTLTFTRTLPPGAEEQVPPTQIPTKKGTTSLRQKPPPTKRTGTSVILAEKYKEKDALPRGTVSIPLERFELGASDAPADAAQASAVGNQWLRGLYRLLREANPCETEDELFAATTRVLAEVLPGARVKVLFEAGLGAQGKGAGKESKEGKEKDPSRQTLLLSTWQAPGISSGSSQNTRVLEARLTDQRNRLLAHARERGVAVLSQDLEADLTAKRATRTIVPEDPKAEKLAVMIAPLQMGRAVLGYLLAERTVRADKTGERNAPFMQEHLEFLAAAAFPLATMLSNVRRHQSVLDQNARLRHSVQERYRIVGESNSLKNVQDVIARAAPFDTPVLILGESGTGKELAARAIHAMSRRADGPFEALNCAALPENLVESELFGHAKGAFTGASGDRAGYFETAHGGTLFLDEVGELPLPVQAKLLRVLEEGKVARVGETRLRDVDCRIVAATNRDLAAEVDANRFRQDLYYRLRVMDITLPPLRARADDLPVLCKHFLAPFGSYRLQPDAMEYFQRYSWPGNIRELRNTLERMAVLAKPQGGAAARGVVALSANDVPLDIKRMVEGAGDPTLPLGQTVPGRKKTSVRTAAIQPAVPGFNVLAADMPPLEKLQVSYARWVLEQVGGNKTKAAKILGIQRSTLYAWTEWNADEKGGDGPQ
ncbi:MAG: sigma 54-interacting transcriptional regulator [Planctomycetota bacterium]|nr:sigma 54-interacting transcriptional regulator [Planctomycetota bacterium]